MIGVVFGGVGALAIGAADFIARFTTTRFGVLAAVCAVNTVGTAYLIALGFATGASYVAPFAPLALSVMSGCLGLVGLALLYIALARGPIAVASPIVAAHPALVALLWYLAGVTPTPLQWFGMAVTLGAAIGVAAVARPAAPDLDGRVASAWPTVMIAGVSMVFVALRLITAQVATDGLGALEVTTISRGVPALLTGLAILVLAGIGRWHRPAVAGGAPVSIVPWLALFLLHGVLEATGSAAVLFGSEGVGRSIAPVVFSAFTAVTVILSWLILKERVSALQALMIAVLIGGIGLLAAAGS